MAFYFAWVDATETTFGVEHQREDEDVFSVSIQHDEGQFPTLNLEVRNPRVGLLSPGRKVWAWLAWDDGATVTPLFFGRLVGIPDNLVAEIVALRFVARPALYPTLKQAYAQTLKLAPFYDPLFLSEERRDDADAILEGYSALWHIDRQASSVTVSDVLDGEDGTEVFTSDEVPYESVSIAVEQPPLKKVQVSGEVTWTQNYSGYVNLGTKSFVTYSGDGILGDWPKPLTSLGDGWTAALATAVDANGVDKAETVSYSFNWQNQEKRHRNGDTMSISASESKPLLLGPYLSQVTSQKVTPGLVDPYATDEQGDPAPINKPGSAQTQMAYVPQWRVNTALIARYDADRQRSEKVVLTVTADVQDVITDDGTAQDVEKISVPGGDVGQPIADVLRWSTVAGTAVSLGQVIFPDTWASVGAAQICTTAGTCALVPPTFSEIVGTATTDGTAVWTSLGEASSFGSAPDWQETSTTPTGTVIMPRRPMSIPYDWLVQQGRIEVPKAGVNVNAGTIVETSNSFQQCTVSGTTGTATPSFSATPGATTVDGSVTWKSLGTELPSGTVYYIATTAGVSGDVLPSFNTAEGTTTTDGTVVWTSLGEAEVPIGGMAGQTGRAAYFPTDRGLRSIEYLICLARARLRLRARVLRVSFDCNFTRALALSCRKNATLNDPRLPGGVVTGKVTSYTIQANGDTGELKGTVTIGCSVGKGTSLTLAAGTPSYVAAGYVADGWQYMDGEIAANDDIGYTPPATGYDPEAVPFPLSRASAVKREAVHGTLAQQETLIRQALADAVEQTNTQDYEAALDALQDTDKATKLTVADALKRSPIWYELELISLTGGPYAAAYYVSTTPLTVPQSIDLSAA